MENASNERWFAVCCKPRQEAVAEENLLRQGFRVYLPILFGEPGDDATMRNTIRSCGTREFDCLSKDSSGAVVRWLRHLSQAIRDREGEPALRMGVIGMCLTGSIPLELAADPWMVALVVSQPALPLFGADQPSERSAADSD